MRHNGATLTRLSLGLVFLWFGALKFVPGLSPAEALVTRTFQALSLGMLDGEVAMPLLACWECAIGLGLLLRVWLRTTLALLFVQMLGTMIPLALFTQDLFVRFPYALSFEGQYIVKNLVLISAGCVVGATVEAPGERHASRRTTTAHPATAVQLHLAIPRARSDS